MLTGNGRDKSQGCVVYFKLSLAIYFLFLILQLSGSPSGRSVPVTSSDNTVELVSIYGVEKVAQLAGVFCGKIRQILVGTGLYWETLQCQGRPGQGRVPCDLSRTDDGKINDPVGLHTTPSTPSSPAGLCKLVPKCGHYLQLDPRLEIDLQLLNRDGIPALA